MTKESGPVLTASVDHARAGRDIRITNIYKQVQAAAPSIASHVRTTEFETLVRDRTQNFVGRELVFEAIERLLAGDDFSSGYVVIHGEPGIGKTTLIAELALRQEYVHHFNIATQNIRSIGDFLASICAQLIVKYRLPYDALPPQAKTDSGFLVRLLNEAAAIQQGERVVVLVDALDEAESDAHGVGNPLFLPPTLPQGVFLIVTSRSKEAERLVVDRREDLYLRDHDPENLVDIRKYAHLYLVHHADQVHERLKVWQISASQLVEEIVQRSDGNFMYLVNVLADLCKGLIAASDLDDVHKLPKGLRGYYQRQWRVMSERDRDRFQTCYEPVVCFLATVRESVTVEQISKGTNLEIPRIKEAVVELEDFLDIDQTAGGEPLYRLYHSSFQDFLREEVGLEKYPAASGS
jgi:hypothetical protein